VELSGVPGRARRSVVKLWRAPWSPGEEFGEAVGQWKKSVKAAAEFSEASVKLSRRIEENWEGRGGRRDDKRAIALRQGFARGNGRGRHEKRINHKRKQDKKDMRFSVLGMCL
jgi:hypothetical protein